MWLRIFAWLLVAGIVACSSTDDETSQDEENQDFSDSGSLETLCDGYPENIACPVLPASPAHPALEDGRDISDWTPPDCAADSMPRFGTSECLVVGAPCPDGIWPEGVTADVIRYVTPDGTGDGTSKELAGNLQDMLSDAPEGATIVLSKGEFAGRVLVRGSYHLVGACAAQTTLKRTGVENWQWSTVTMTGAGAASIKNLNIQGDGIGVVIGDSDEVKSLSGVIVDSTRSFGFFVQNGELLLEDAVVRNTQSRDDGLMGMGLYFQEAGRGTLRRVMLDTNQSHGLALSDTGSVVSARELVSQNTLSSNGEDPAFGVQVSDGAELDLQFGLFRQNAGVGVAVSGEGTLVKMADTMIAATKTRTDGIWGRGFTLYQGAQAELSRVMIAQNRNVGCLVQDAGSVLTADDIFIVDTETDSVGDNGYGLRVDPGARVVLNRAQIRANRKNGVRLTGANLELVDASITETMLQNNEEDGYGILVMAGASVYGQQVLLEANHTTGLSVQDEMSEVTMQDLVVTQTKSLPDGSFGRGVSVTSGASLNLERAYIGQNRELGMGVWDSGTRLEATDLVVRYTQPNPEGKIGRGILVQDGASVAVQDADFSMNREIAVTVIGQDTQFQAEQFNIFSTLFPLCKEQTQPTCGSDYADFADAILILGGAQVELSDFRIEDNGRVGIHLLDENYTSTSQAGSPILNAQDGSILRNRIGVMLRADDVGTQSFSAVGCFDNPETEDGCFSRVGVEVPGLEF